MGQLADLRRARRSRSRSGMAFQVDIIPATGGPYFTTNIEDGIALADEPLRERVRRVVPSGLGTDRGAAGLHGRCARDRAPSRRPALLEPAGLPAAVPAPSGSGDDGGGLVSDAGELVRIADGPLEVEILPGGRGAPPPPARVRPRPAPDAADDLGRHARRSVLLGQLPDGPVVQPGPGRPGRSRRAADRPAGHLPGRHRDPRPGLADAWRIVEAGRRRHVPDRRRWRWLALALHGRAADLGRGATARDGVRA